MIQSTGTFRLGLPAWAHPSWKGHYFDARPTTLASYASVFDTVEGNTTFYHTPDPRTVASWVEGVAGSDFNFCFKLPREITHERRWSMQQLESFLDTVAPLKNNIGPFLLQFPAWADERHLARFEPAFERISETHGAIVEVRNPLLFSEPERLDPTLFHHGFGRVMYDSRPMYQGDTSHPDVLSALHEKPDVPVLTTVYNQLELVRLILHPDPPTNDRWMDHWAKRTADMLAEGVDVWMMIHCPNNWHCPPFARTFHERLQSELTGRGVAALPPLPPWPVPQQASLF